MAFNPFTFCHQEPTYLPCSEIQRQLAGAGKIERAKIGMRTVFKMFCSILKNF